MRWRDGLLCFGSVVLMGVVEMVRLAAWVGRDIESRTDYWEGVVLLDCGAPKGSDSGLGWLRWFGSR